MHIDLVVILMMLKGVPASNGVRPANWFESSGGTRAPSRVPEACAGAPAPPGAFRDSHDYRVLTVIVGFLRRLRRPAHWSPRGAPPTFPALNAENALSVAINFNLCTRAYAKTLILQPGSKCPELP